MNGNVDEALHFSIRHLLGTRSMLQSGRLVCTVIAPLAVQVEIFGATGIFLRREAFFHPHIRAIKEMWAVFKILLSFHSTGCFLGIPYWSIVIPNILGSIIPYKHQQGFWTLLMYCIQYLWNTQAGAGIIRMSCAGVMGKQAISTLSIHSTAMDISALMVWQLTTSRGWKGDIIT